MILLERIRFWGEDPAPQFEENFGLANQKDGNSIAGRVKMADNKFVNKKKGKIGCNI